jgi:transcriptional regulator with XRE-family HTH domain
LDRFIEEILKARGYESRAKFARRGGVTYQTVRRWELGKTVPASGAHIGFLVNEGIERDVIEAARATVLRQVAQ